jgi:branched-chain amino acid transport system substrate-binding protein
MTITRRNVLLGATASAALLPIAARAQTPEVVIGVIYPLSGASAQIGVDAQKSYETAAEVINKNYDFDLPLARGEGLSGLGGAKVRLVFADHQADPQKGRAEAERLITQEKVCAIIGTYQSAVAVTVSQICERYQIPFISADNSSPSLHRRGLKFYFRAAPHDEMFSGAMFDFFDAMKKKGTKIETLALFHEDTIFGTDSGNAQLKLAGEPGYKVLADIKYRSNSPSLSAEVQQLKAANADVLMPSSYTTDGILLVKTMAELGYKSNAIVAQDAGFSEKALYDAVGDKLEGVISRGSSRSRRQAADGRQDQRHVQGKSGKDLNDFVAAVMGLIVMADAIIAPSPPTATRSVKRWLRPICRARPPSCRKRVKFDETARTTTPIRCCCNMSAASSSPPSRRKPRSPNLADGRRSRGRGAVT